MTLSALSDEIRLMQILVGEPLGGAERFFVKLANALQKRDLVQKVVILRDEKRAADLYAGGCDVLQLDFSKGLSDIGARIRLNRKVAHFKPNIVLAWMNRAARRMPSGDFIKVGRLGGYYPLKYYNKCDWLIGNTPDLVEYMKKENWPAERAIMLSNFGELSPLAKISKSLLDTPENSPVLLSMGRLHASKGFDTLLKVLARLPGVYLWLAGEGDLLQDLKGEAAKLGVDDRVRFLGWRDDQAALLASCDICVVPSRHEPLSNVIVEAWSLQVPVVASASEGPSWLIDEGQNGLLCPIDDVEAMASAIKRVLDDPTLKRSIAAGGYEKWSKEFSESVIVDQYIDFFKEILKK